MFEYERKKCEGMRRRLMALARAIERAPRARVLATRGAWSLGGEGLSVFHLLSRKGGEGAAASHAAMLAHMWGDYARMWAEAEVRPARFKARLSGLTYDRWVNLAHPRARACAFEIDSISDE